MNSGGPAFPGVWRNESDANIIAPNGVSVPPRWSTHIHGMSLRDYFAAKALAGELAAQDGDTVGYWSNSNENLAALAQRCYLIADAMLKAREE
jgi:hypothetical protein